jgi:hypothetical protein
MAVHQTIHYELASAADLHRLVDDMSRIDAATVVVAFRPSHAWHASDVELARLVAAARTAGKQLIAERDADAVAERAVLMGFHDLAVVSDRPDSTLRDTSAISTAMTEVEGQTTPESNNESDDPTAVIKHEDQYDSTANLATYKPIGQDITITWNRQGPDEGRDVGGNDSSEREPYLAQRHRSRSSVFRTVKPVSSHVHHVRSAPPTMPAIRQPVQISRPEPIDDKTFSEPRSLEVVTRRRKHLGLIKIAAAVLAPVLVLAVVAAMAVYLLPTAEITLVPQEEPISSSLTYGIAAANAEFDITMDPTPISSTSTASASTEATGERFEPAGTASGLIQITNPLTNDVTVPAGTEVPGANGVMYYTAEDIQIPAADPYGSLAFGSATVGVYAGVVGPDGNLNAGALTGQLGTQMFYTNPQGISGGRMDRFPVITQEDVDAVRTRVSEELMDIVEGELVAEIPDDHEIVPGTLEVGDPDVEVSAEPGQDGDEVSASGTIKVRAQMYYPEELHQLAGGEADRLLARQGGNDRILLAETVAIKDPTNLENGIPAFQIEVEAIARKVITESEKEQIIQEVTGLSREEAEEIIAEHPKVERFQITIEPDWLLDRMPEIKTRISVLVSSGEPTASTR